MVRVRYLLSVNLWRGFIMGLAWKHFTIGCKATLTCPFKFSVRLSINSSGQSGNLFKRTAAIYKHRAHQCR